MDTQNLKKKKKKRKTRFKFLPCYWYLLSLSAWTWVLIKELQCAASSIKNEVLMLIKNLEEYFIRLINSQENNARKIKKLHETLANELEKD